MAPGVVKGMRDKGRRPGALYLDNGSTYRGAVLQTLCARLGIGLLHAEAGIVEQRQPRSERQGRFARRHAAMAAARHDLAAIAHGRERDRIHAQDAPGHGARFGERRRPGMRPRGCFQELGGLCHALAGLDAAGFGQRICASDDAALQHVGAIANARAAAQHRRHRHALRLGPGEAAHAGFIAADAGIVVDRRPCAGLGREVGGIHRAVRAANHHGAVCGGRQLGDAGNGEDRNGHGDSLPTNGLYLRA